MTTSAAVVASPQRQPATPPTAPVSTRPVSPPIVVPAMYRPPMADARPGPGLGHQVRHGQRRQRAERQPGDRRAAPAAPRTTVPAAPAGRRSTATTAEIVIARARPIRSATAAQGSTERASAPVATDTASDTVDSVSSHSAAIAGSTACTA